MLGSLISAGAALLGGSSSQSSADKRAAAANRMAALQAKKANKVGRKQFARQLKLMRQERQRQNVWAQKNIDMQTTFAKEGLRWKVDDAKAAGIHPLYGLGASTTSFSPVSVGGVSAPGSPGYVSPEHTTAPLVDSGIAAAGQDIGRAVSAMQTPQERMATALNLERLALDNELVRAQITAIRNRMTGTGPGMPSNTGPVVMGGRTFETHPGWVDAETMQQRYGEPAEWGYFPFVASADFYQNWDNIRADLERWKRSRPGDAYRYKFFEK